MDAWQHRGSFHLDVTHLQHAWSFYRETILAPRKSFYPRKQFVKIERPGEIIVSAPTERPDLVFGIIHRRQH
jgi:hypothetical protein